MSQPTIFVQVPQPKKGDGKKTVDEAARVCPIHANDNPHGGHELKKPDDGAFEVYDSATIRRRIRSGDLELASAPKPASKKEG